MIHRGILAITAVIVAAMSLSCTKRQTLTISAAASLRKPLLEIGRHFEETNRDLSLVYNFAGSGSLQEQIRRGAPVDIFIAAGNRPIDLLEAEGLIQPGIRFGRTRTAPRSRVDAHKPLVRYNRTSCGRMTNGDVELLDVIPTD